MQKTAAGHWQVCIRQYCAEISEAARNRMELIVRSLAEQNGVTDRTFLIYSKVAVELFIDFMI